jgi:hypothetical protein
MANAAAARVGPGGEHGGGHDRADPGQLEQVRSPGPHDGADGLLVAERLGLEKADAAGQVALHGQGGDDLDVAAAAARTQGSCGGDHGADGLPAEACAHRLRGGDDHRQQLPLRGGGSLDRGPPCGQAHLQRGPLGTGLGLSQPGASQRIASGALGVDRVGLGPGSSRGPLRAIEFDDQLISVGEMPGQAGAVAAGALHRPGAQAGVLLGQGNQLAVAVRVGGHGRSGQHGPVSCIKDRGGVCLTVGVDADDDLDQLCQHGHAFSPHQMGRSRSRAGAEMAGL